MIIQIACSAGIILSAVYAGCMNSTGAVFLTSVVLLGCWYDVCARNFGVPGLFDLNISAASKPLESAGLWYKGWTKYRPVHLFSNLSILIFMVSQHKIPGFFNVCLLRNIQLSAQSIPYTLWFNWDKALMACIVWVVFMPWQIQRYAQWLGQWGIKCYRLINRLSDAPNNRPIMTKPSAKSWPAPNASPITPAWPMHEGSKESTFFGLGVPTWARVFLPMGYFLVCIALVSNIGLATGYIQWDIKWPSIMPLWCLNMMAVCFSEEVFYRGFFQHRIRMFLPKKVCAYSGHIVLSAAFFAVDHALKGGLTYGFLSGITGFFYGFVFENKKSIAYSMAFHFLFNLVHIVFFTYPASISVIRG